MMAFDFDGNVSIWATSKHQQAFQKEGPEVLKQKQTDGVASGASEVAASSRYVSWP